MKAKKADRARKRSATAQAGEPPMSPWAWAGLAIGAFVITLIAYGPALSGAFLFDDLYLPFFSDQLTAAPLLGWIMGTRPLLMLTYWANYRMSGLEPFSYHLVNVLLHFVNSVLVFVIVRKLLRWKESQPPQRELVAAFAALVYLLHPIQTEAVSYVASRSETLSVLFCYGAFALFLGRKSESISWRGAFAVILLFGMAVLTKEHTAALAALLLLTDVYWRRGPMWEGVRRNWRLYAPLTAAAALGGLFIYRVLRDAETAGFGMANLGGREYLFTQFRAIWQYLRMVVLPYGQNIDHPFAISRSLLDHGSIFGLLALLGVIAMAFYFRDRFPLAFYGLLAFLLLLAPTSSIVPIADPFAERRLYLPMIGLLLIAADFLTHWRIPLPRMAGAFAAVLLALIALTHHRNQVWGDSIALWEDSVEKAPENYRARFNLAFTYYQTGRCQEAVAEYERASLLKTPDEKLYVDWALAHECLNQDDIALERLEQAAQLMESAHIYSQIGMLYGKQGRHTESRVALERALELDPSFDMTYVYLGHLHQEANELAAASERYRQALSLNPQNGDARRNLFAVETRLRRR
jgi:protein O-mannosyl-transferase